MKWDWTIREAIAKAEHLIAIGDMEVAIRQDDPRISELWPRVVSVAPGGSHRLEIATDVRFVATHPCGLRFRWSFDIEPQSANGSGSYHIDAEGCRNILVALPEPAKAAFRSYLADCAMKVGAKASEFAAAASRQRRDAEMLETLAMEPSR